MTSTGDGSKTVEVQTAPYTEYYRERSGSEDSDHIDIAPAATANASTASTHGVPQIIGTDNGTVDATRDVEGQRMSTREKINVARKNWFAYVKTKDFWIVLLLGQVLSVCITSTNTFSGLLSRDGTSIPAFQILFNYILLNLVFTSYTLYRYGFKKWAMLIFKDGWRYFILSFCDVEGNYFVILAYRYTTILSAQLINFWAIVVVVIVSLIFLGVRYKWSQYVGIIICVGGMGILIASDHITGANGGKVPDQVKGDLFALVGATFYGFSNCFEEFLVSKRPLYEVIGQLAFWGMCISGVQIGIFDRHSIQHANWSGAVGGYLVGFTLILSLFYTLAPILFRLSSAAFFNISLLTANFWGVCVGIQVFHLHIHYLYPIAFVLILVGLAVYFITESVEGESKKPWLGENQEHGIDGVFTARRKADRTANLREGTPAAGVV